MLYHVSLLGVQSQQIAYPTPGTGLHSRTCVLLRARLLLACLILEYELLSLFSGADCSSLDPRLFVPTSLGVFVYSSTGAASWNEGWDLQI